jgi:hypothetical protein
MEKKNVYYCDHCKKRTLSGGSMKTHEKHCTNNPDRQCRLCGMGSIKGLIETFKARFTLRKQEYDIWTEEYPGEYVVIWTGEPVTLQEIRDEVGNCPNCIFSIIRQVGFNRHYFKFEAFDYKKELQEELAERNHYSADEYYY